MNPGRSIAILFLCCIVLKLSTAAQQKDFTFRQVTASQGLADGVVLAIGQDKYGYIWISTLSGLNRFNGYAVLPYFNDAKDSTSLPPTPIKSIKCDKKGNLWFGCNRGIFRFDYAGARFLPAKALKDVRVFKIIDEQWGKFYVATSKGVALFDPYKESVSFLKDQQNINNSHLLGIQPNDLFLKSDRLYIATDTGLVVFNTRTNTAELKTNNVLKNQSVKKVAVDSADNLWLSYNTNPSFLFKSDIELKSTVHYDQFSYSWVGNKGGNILDFLIDKKGDLWMSTSGSGLVHYDNATNSFHEYRNDLLRPTSLLANHVTSLYQGGDGFIWMGTEGYGVNYFHPERNLFQTLLPPKQAMEHMSSLWSRSIEFDNKGNYWLGLAEGLVKVNTSSGAYKYYRNTKEQTQLHYNSVRALLYDHKDRLWIGTTNGVNRFNDQTGVMEFLDEKDSLPKGFTWNISIDSRKTIWIGTHDNIFFLADSTKQIHSIAAHPDLSKYKMYGARIVYEDSRHCLWFGLAGMGLIYYNPLTRVSRYWRRTPENDTTIINNVITAITEDKHGIVWFSTPTGLMAYDAGTDKFSWLTEKNGLPSIKTSSLMVDDRNRLWVGSTKGLLLLDSTRKNVKTFDMQDGLPAMNFTDMPAYKTKSGEFVFATMKGFLVFNPGNYIEQTTAVHPFISSVKILGEKLASKINAEELHELSLRHFQNFFSFELASFNYSNPEQTWYAYKLEGFDKSWHYTRERVVNYTNVPGGDYTFIYKASEDPNNWNVSEKTLSIHIGTVFYKAWWFWAIIFSTVIGFAYAYYKNRMVQQRRIFILQTKAQALEKEKALVMYENLKQQLNPHFLFNSLTSLSSLIKLDQKLASQFLDGMSKIYRYILKSRDNEVVSLAEELKFVENYIRLQKTRFEATLQVMIDIPEEEHYKKIAPVTLQNLIENAIKHNILDEESPLVIEIFTEDNYLVARNNLQRKNVVDSSNKQGLVNLKSLYKYLTKRSIVIEEDARYYTIKIPLI